MPHPADVPHPESSGGGSESLKAFRAMLAAEGVVAATPPAPSAVSSESASRKPQEAAARPGIEARAAERKIVNGRARVTLGGGSVVMGKMLDVSKTGASVMMEDLLPVKKTCTLDVDIFHNGKRYAFSVPALSVYAVLASGKGFKVGFQFGPCTPAASQTLDELLK